MYRLYLSGSLMSAKQIEKVCLKFTSNIFNFFLPHTIENTNIAHFKLPKEIFEICINEMEKADICLLNLDSYGRDSSWECGWFNAHNKPVIGYVSANLSFLQDWMIKGGLQGILVDNKAILESILNDPILKHIKKNILLFDQLMLYNQISEIMNNNK